MQPPLQHKKYSSDYIIRKYSPYKHTSTQKLECMIVCGARRKNATTTSPSVTSLVVFAFCSVYLVYLVCSLRLCCVRKTNLVSVVCSATSIGEHGRPVGVKTQSAVPIFWHFSCNTWYFFADFTRADVSRTPSVHTTIVFCFFVPGTDAIYNNDLACAHSHLFCGTCVSSGQWKRDTGRRHRVPSPEL